ncbi:sensor histidine kinase [Granulicella arctica]|uniref:sensor histidine kinase n=1 Tax=Granulicella arctica TaxID=940613 RepID=UPI0021E09F99|nr:sensor histidine kinase [Granulicella arctica]
MTRPGSVRAAWKHFVNQLAVAGLFLVLGIVCPSAFALVPASSIHDAYHSHWTVPDGAPSITSIAQGKDGYLWLGTSHGLYFFDGISFKAYQVNHDGEALSRDISVVKSLPDGGLWVGYEQGGASFLLNDHLVTYSAADGLAQGTVRAFARDRKGTIWAATQYGLVRLIGSRWQNVGVHWGYPSEYPDNVFVDSRGTLWTSTRDGLSFLREGEVQFHLVASKRLQNVDFSESPDGTVWLASAVGSIRAITTHDGNYTATGIAYPFRSEGIHIDSEGALWITTVDHGVFLIADPEAKSKIRSNGTNAEHFAAQDGLTSDYAFDVIESRERGIWVVTAKGLDQFRSIPFSPVKLLAGSTYLAMAADANGGLIIASDQLAQVHDNVAIPVRDAPKGVECVYRDPSSHLWLANSEHLYQLSGSRFISYPLPSGLDDNPHVVQAMTMDKDGALWVSYLHDGVFRLVGSTWDRSGGLATLPKNPAVSMFTDSEQRLWFGYIDNQIITIRGKELTHIGAAQGLSLSVVTSLVEIAKRIWAGGAQGLEFDDGGNFRHLLVAGEDQLSGVSGVATSQDGDFWLNTALGVFHIPSHEIELALANPTYRVHADRFTYLDGLTGTPEQLHHLPTVISAQNGRLYFALQGSVTWLNPSELKRNLLPPPVWIQSATADGQVYRHPSLITLPKNTRSLIIDYAAPSLLIPQRVRFKYRLDGIDQGWQEPGTRREAVYSRLPPGHYRFQVIASNNDDVWNEAGASLGFDIPPTFLQSMLFRLLCGVVFVVFLWLLYWVRLHQMTQRLKEHLYARVSERERIARDLHDTFLQGVQGVLLSFHTATKHIDGNEQSRQLLKEAFRKSDQVMLDGRGLILNLRGEGTETDNLPRSLSVVGNEFSKAHTTSFSLVVTGHICDLHPIVRDELYRITREAIANAFHHAAAAKVEVEMIYGDQQFVLRVRDNGVGIDPKILRAGFREKHWGLPGMRERAKTIGAELDLWSQLKAGTEWELRMPMNVARPPPQKR